jgi:Flp pilus assembly protein TadG
MGFSKRRHGSAAVELAVVFPVFLMIIFGIIEFGQAFLVEHLLANAARVGARRAIIDGSSNSKIEQQVKDHCASTLGVSASNFKVAIAVKRAGSSMDDDDKSGGDLSTATTGDLCTVSISVAFDEVDLMPGSLFGGAQLSGTCAMEHE